MSNKMNQDWRMTIGVMVVIVLAATKKTDAQAFLLTYSDERISTRIGQKPIELGNDTDITEVYTIKTSSRIPSELSQTTMDAITIIWYVSTFLALMAFFFLMACSDRKCGHPDPSSTLEDQIQPPPTPSPSYSEFAPPSYETVMNKQFAPVFVVQVPYLETEKDPPPSFSFLTVNELQKIGS